MSEIKTQIVRSEREISSQNLVVRNYSEQLKSAVISDLRRKEILKKMRSELTAQQFHRPEIRSAENAVKTVTETHSINSLQTSVNNDFIHTQRHTDYIKKAKVSYSEDVKSVIAASEDLEEKIQSADKIFRRKAILRNMQISEFVKERGLGTPATRAAIIEELIAAGYIERKKKQLVSTEYGRKFAAFLPENVKSAELTARWEQALSDIENGIGSADGLLSEIIKNVSDIVSLEKSRGSRETVSRTKTVGTCPRCGKPVIENSKGFSCSAGRENCGFFIFKSDKRIGRNYTAAEISELLSTGRVTLKNCVSSNGKKYSAVFSMDDTVKYVNLRFERFA